MSEDLFKNPFKTELYEFEGEEEAPTPIGFFGMRQRRRDGTGGRIVGTTSPKFHKARHTLPSHIRTQDQADQWAMENGAPYRPRKRVTVRDISTNHSGGGPLEEVWIRDRNGKLVNTDRGGYVDPKTNQNVPHTPLPGNWKRLDSGMKPKTSPVDKSQWPKASDHFDPINKEIFRQKEEDQRKKEEARELRRIETEQRNAMRKMRMDREMEKLNNPSEPKPRGRPPKSNKWW